MQKKALQETCNGTTAFKTQSKSKVILGSYQRSASFHGCFCELPRVRLSIDHFTAVFNERRMHETF
jgi:hypothetical protein